MLSRQDMHKPTVFATFPPLAWARQKPDRSAVFPAHRVTPVVASGRVSHGPRRALPAMGSAKAWVFFDRRRSGRKGLNAAKAGALRGAVFPLL